MIHMINPFNPNHPASDRFFANRRRELAWIQQFLLPSLSAEGAGPENLAILGPWGIGKSSLAHRIRSLAPGADVPVVPVYFACTRGYGTLVAFAEALVTAVANELRQHRPNWPAAIQDELARWQPTIHLPLATFTRRPQRPDAVSANAVDILRSNLRDLWERVLASTTGGVVLILDDVHTLFALDPEALLILRAVFQDLHLQGCRYALVVTGPPTLFEDLRDVSEPVLRFFERMALAPFDLADCIQAIRHPLELVNAPFSVTDEACEWVWQRTDGHPYFVAFYLRDLVAEAVAARWTTIDVSHCRLVDAAIVLHLERERFAVEWDDATPAERKVLLQVLDATDRSPYRPRANVNRGLITRLVRKGLLSRVGRGAYTLYHPLFAEFVRRHAIDDAP